MLYQAKEGDMSNLLQRVHSIKNPQELVDMLHTLQDEDECPAFNLFQDTNSDKTVTSTSSSYKCRYYNNHIGREINKKIKLLIINQDIPDARGDDITQANDYAFLYKGQPITGPEPLDGGLRPKVIAQ